MRFLFLALLLPLSVFAKPQVPAPGAYGYHGEFQVEMKKRYETVVAFTPDGAARLEKLRAAGHICTNTGRQIYLCTDFEDPKGSETEVASRVEERLGGARAEFLERAADPELVAKGKDYEEWKVLQPVRFLGVTYPFYRYVITQGLHKIMLGEPADEGFVVDPETGVLTNYFDESVTESRFVYRIYMVGGQLVREQ